MHHTNITTIAPSATPTDSSSEGATLNFTTFFNVIDSKLVKTTNVRHSINPTIKESVWAVQVATQDYFDKVVIAAQIACKVWSRCLLEDRVYLPMKDLKILHVMAGITIPIRKGTQ
jgi:hypothetical protein